MSATNDQKLKIYDQLCTSYRAIDDFRAKLLGFIPLATGTGIFLLLDLMTGDTNILDLMTGDTNTDNTLTPEAKSLFTAAGVFGFLITLGLFFYEIYGIKKCHALIKAGRRLEESLDLNGEFRSRPPNALYLINEPFAAGVIYPTVLAAWVFFTLLFWWPEANPCIPFYVAGAGFASIFLYEIKLRIESYLENRGFCPKCSSERRHTVVAC